ncbi:hypothetical protein LRM36_11610 [Stenotrophomonas maltophilia]|uniref:hypothetical protein n=1 Tax=Stenotrophomonas TaxID=40323 RepID=UPI0019D42268|nr:MULTISPECIES: hypothetical protein [Stenotrophomonas]MBN7839008.1 hypothetical protein [Stenotrophomonas maltophilia]MDA3307331.1 hypothetical protein [Stenotrophomonas sp. PI_27]MDA5339058.1 hypothetical protein [Stenotrophomonas maltophilia]WGS56774.1 hypothetical protein IAI57_18115 [Stenotrophomonas pavanii]
MLGIHRWLRVGLIFTLAGALGACNSRVPDAAGPLDLVKPINLAEPGQAVRFELETNARNFYPGRPYVLDLEVQRHGPGPDSEADMDNVHVPFQLSLQRWVAGAWQDVATSDVYQARARSLGQPLPEWHESADWRYAQQVSMDASRYRLNIVTLPMEIDARYRLDVRTVQPTLLLQHYPAQLRVHADPLSGK